MRRTTIQDVANLAGVGKVTVSYVLNGQSKTARISDETAEKVLQAARDLNYRPNAVARMLATKETKTLAIVFQYGAYFSTWSSFTNEVMRGVCAATVELGYDLMLHTKHVGNPHTEADALADGRVDGVLILRDQDDATLKELLDRKFPVVQFFTRSDDSRAAWVDADNYYGGQLATRHLLELGHRRIAMIRGGAGSVSSNDRFNGYRDAMESAGVKVPANYGFNNATTAVCTSVDATNGIGIGAGQVNSALCTASTLLPGVSQTSYVFADPVYLTPSAQRQFGTYAYDRLRARW